MPTAGLSDLRAVTLYQPYAHSVFLADPPKDVENRRWPVNYRGPLFIHAGMACDAAAPDYAWVTAHSEHLHGFIIGYVELYDCIHPFRTRKLLGSRWAQPGYFWWLMRNPVLLRSPVPVRGYQSLWKIPTRAADRLAAQLDLEAIIREYTPRYLADEGTDERDSATA